MPNHFWNLFFWTPGRAPADRLSVFGCSSHGLCTGASWIEPSQPGLATWTPSLDGSVLAGTFAEVTASLSSLDFSPSLFLVFAATGTGAEPLLETLHRSFPGVAVAGGCAARLAERGELAPAAPEVSLLAVRTGTYEVECLNVLDSSVSLEFAAAGPRALRSLQEQPGGPLLPAAQAFAKLQQRCGKSASDFESVTLSDSSGRNLHFRQEEGRLLSGADLPAEGILELRAATPSAIAARLDAQLAVPGTLLLACAGLRSVLPRSLTAAEGSLAAFLFGEIGPVASRPAFGNLMVTRVRKLL